MKIDMKMDGKIKKNVDGGNKEDNKQEIIEKLKIKIKKAVEKNLPDENYIGVLFSGGVDSTLIAYLLKDMGKNIICFTSALAEEGLVQSKDLVASKRAAEKYDFPLDISEINLKEMEEVIPKVMRIIKSDNVVKVGVAIPIHLAIEKAAKKGIRTVMSGIGSEEIFAGYERHAQALDINEECKAGLERIKERDLDRDNAIAEYHKINLKSPLLEKELVDFALTIPGDYKIKDGENKLILREAAIEMGLDNETAMRKKIGAQYGSGFDKGLQKIAKKNGFKYKSEYLRSLNIVL